MEILTPAMVYWVGVVDSIKYLVLVLSNLSMISGVMALVFYSFQYIENGVNYPKIRKLAIILISIALMSLTIRVFIPNGKTIAAMYVLPPIVNNESVQALPSEVLDFVRGYIKQYTPKDIDDV